MTTTYYRDGSVHINSTAIRVRDNWYPLSTFTYVWHRRTGRLRRSGYMLLSRGGAVAIIVGLLVAAGVVARGMDFRGRTGLMVGGVLGIVVVASILAFAMEYLLDVVDRTHEHGRGHHEIWVRTGDRDQMIYSTTDTTRFGQIYRALQRAIESGD